MAVPSTRKRLHTPWNIYFDDLALDLCSCDRQSAAYADSDCLIRDQGLAKSVIAAISNYAPLGHRMDISSCWKLCTMRRKR